MQPKTAELLAFSMKCWTLSIQTIFCYSRWRWWNGIWYVYFDYGEIGAFGSLVGVTAHEMAHSWFQFVLATNETKHEWMDEGFTSYISNLAMNKILPQKKPEKSI